MLDNSSVKKVYTYSRVSTDMQDIETQIFNLRNYCKTNNYIIVHEYIDDGISGKNMDDRAAFQEMLSNLDKVDAVVFPKQDRMSRSILDSGALLQIFKEANCKMITIDDGEIKTNTPDEEMMFYMKAIFAQRERKVTIARITDKFEKKRSIGEVCSGQKKYGYDIVDKKWIINEEEAQKIKDFYNYYIETSGDTELTIKYFKENFNKGYDAYKAYLKDTAYIGKYKLYKKEEYLENYIPRILDDETFYKVQDLLLKKRRFSRRNGKERPYSIFDGLIVCGECGKRLARHFHFDNKYDKVYVAYKCYNTRMQSANPCSNKRQITQLNVEKQLLAMIKEEAEKYIVHNEIKIVDTPKKPKDNSAVINQKLERLKDLYIDGELTKVEYHKRRDKLLKELEANNKALKEIESTKDLSFLKSLIDSNFSELYSNLSPVERRTFWTSIIDKIIIKDGLISSIIFL